MFFDSIRNVLLFFNHFQIILIIIIMVGCSFFSQMEQEDPINKIAIDEPSTEYSPKSQSIPPKEQWIEEQEIPSTRGSSATEAVNEVMGEDVDLITQDYLEGNGEYWVSTEKLNIRSGPSSRYEKVGSLRKGMKVIVLERRGNWIRIEANQWISKNYISSQP